MKDKIVAVLYHWLGSKFRVFVIKEMANAVHSQYVEAYVQFGLADTDKDFLTWLEEDYE